MIIISYLLLLLLNFYFLTFFIKIAKKKQIVAIGNNKNLHTGIIPRGAGIVFGVIYILCIVLASVEGYIINDIFYPIVFASVSCLILGFLDDIYDIKISVKFLSQLFIISSLMFYFYNPFLYENYFTLNFIFVMMLILFAIWMLNAYNFLDGADGHLTSVSCMQCLLIIVVLYINNKFELIIPAFVLLSLLLIFLKFNWSPAKVFMGDAGSLFIGINFIVYILILLKLSLVSVYLIVIIFSYYLIDTFGTLILRTALSKTWRNRHRSHPYQNFSRIYSHEKMSKYVIIYHFIWLLPILILANIFSNYEIYFCLIAIIPSIIFLIKFGPIYSSE